MDLFLDSVWQFSNSTDDSSIKTFDRIKLEYHLHSVSIVIDLDTVVVRNLLWKDVQDKYSVEIIENVSDIKV
jgi:hypothetical protein